MEAPKGHRPGAGEGPGRASGRTGLEGLKMILKDLKIEESAIIRKVGGEGALRQHFLDMGLIPGVEVTMVKLAPLGDPMEIRLHGYELTLRKEEAARIEVELLYENEEKLKDRGSAAAADQGAETAGKLSESAPANAAGDVTAAELIRETEHPGLGEGGRFHSKDEEDPLPEGTTLTYALVGNQNSGKTTLFNQLTGSNQHVGNFPGVTVDRKDGVIKGHPDTLVTDLPGIYSMSPYSSEEIVSRNFVLEEKPAAIINIVDATNIQRNLYLTIQLLEMNKPMVVALNMMDEVTGNGGSIDINAMEAALGVPVVPISAAKNQGVDELVQHAVHIAHFQERPLRQDYCSEEHKNGAVHRCVHAVMHLIQDHAERTGIPLRFAAGKLIEGDHLIKEALELDQNEIETLEHMILQMEKECGLDRSAAMADMRFTFIKNVTEAAVKKRIESKERARSLKLDRIFTGKYTAIPVFIEIMIAIFILTFNVIGAWLQGLLETGIGALADITDKAMSAAGVNEVVHSLVKDGIFAGVGSVLSFVPIIVVLFFFLSLLEDSGYTARVAFIMDKLLRKIGLSGRSIVPMLIGFGCTVPAVMATRTLPSERDRKMTILLTPFMSCSAKIPIYAFFASAFFPHHGGFVMTGLYLLGIVVGVLMAVIFKNTLFKGEAVPFVMELPNYRMPTPKNVLRLMWDKAKDFLQRAFTIIFIATIVIWFLQSFSPQMHFVTDSGESLLAKLAEVIAPVFAPLGLGDWRICTALISGFIAKESVVATLQVLFGAGGGIAASMTALAAGTVLVFSLLYTPCVAAIASVKRELGARWSVLMIVWQCVLAWICALLFRLIAGLF